MTLDDLATLLKNHPKHDANGEPSTLFMVSNGRTVTAKVVAIRGGDFLVVPFDDPLDGAELSPPEDGDEDVQIPGLPA